MGRRPGLAELLANLGNGSGAPYILQRRMDMRESAGRRADHQLGRAWTKQRADAWPGYRNIPQVRTGASAPDY
jgi:hypothetical protein